jgi:hypothetical protein
VDVHVAVRHGTGFWGCCVHGGSVPRWIFDVHEIPRPVQICVLGHTRKQPGWFKFETHDTDKSLVTHMQN